MLNNKESHTSHSNESNQKQAEPEIYIKVYKKRWIVLALHTFLIISNSIQMLQYSVIADVIQKYYQVSYALIDWTTILPSLMYVIFIFPASYLMEKLGLRKTVIIATICNSIGMCIKIASVHPDKFWLVLLGQGIIGMIQVCITPVIPLLTATWFGYQEIATATGLCLTGILIGSSLSFLLPPLLIVEGGTTDIERGLYILNISYSIFATILVPLIIFFFSEKPEIPPSLAQYNLIKNRKNENSVHSQSFLKQWKSAISNRSYVIFVFIMGINSGSVAAMQNLANQIVLNYYPHAALDVGILGLLHIAFCIVGSIVCSISLDRYKKFRESAYILCGLLILSWVFFAATLNLGLPFVYLSFIILGLFWGALLTANVEIIVELTYPQSQTIMLGFSVNWTQMSILLFTILYGHVHRNLTNNWANIITIGIIFLADLLLFLVTFDLNRKEVQTKMSQNGIS